MGAPLGNQNAVGNNGGVAPKYTTASEIECLIDQYFEDCDGKPYLDDDGKPMLNKYGEPIIIGQKPYTVTGLALALGFNSRMSLLNYQDKVEFMDTIKRAKSRIESYAESRLYDRDGVNGAKFSLINNFKGWKESQSIDINGDQPIQVQHVHQLSDDQLEQIESMFQQQLPGEIIDI